MTITHPVIASMRDERDPEQPTVTVSALDTLVIEDGDDMPAEHIRVEHANCFCQDGRHRHEDRTDWARSDGWKAVGAHQIIAHMYGVITEVKP